MAIEASSPDLLRRLPEARGRLTQMRPLADFTWFRVGGPAEVLFQPADARDLSEFLATCPADIPVTTIGVGSNLLVRDGGVPGVVIRLGRAFNMITTEGTRVTAGAAALDARVAVAVANAGITGLEFLRGIPGTIGGALAMNAGCYGVEIKDVLVEAFGIDRAGRRITIPAAEMGFSYRNASAAPGLIFIGGIFDGRADDATAVTDRMEALLANREAAQPVRERTGGSTFRNPAGYSSTGREGDSDDLKAWKAIDDAGCRGLRVGGAQVSEKHCNFLINTGTASASDLEELGESVRVRVKSNSGIDLHWEIRRIGVIVSKPKTA